jgi:hypothetical protein
MVVVLILLACLRYQLLSTRSRRTDRQAIIGTDPSGFALGTSQVGVDCGHGGFRDDPDRALAGLSDFNCRDHVTPCGGLKA